MSNNIYGDIMKKFKTILIILSILITLYLSLYLIAFLMPSIKLNKTNNYYLYDINNNLYQTSSSGWINIEDIDKDVINATIAVEDKHFYKHIGFDYLRIIKALMINIKNGSNLQGASTITQQYAKNLYLDFDKNWMRKIEEAWLTIRMETHYTKDEILEGYLNTINYGGVFGIENASKYYFNKSASNLTLAEASILAGIPKSPTYYSPIENKDNAKTRQKLVLQAMVNNGYIENKDMISAYNKELTFYGNLENTSSSLLYYQDAVINELKSINAIPKSLIETGGLKVYTNLNIDIQKELENNIDKYVIDDMQAAGVITIPKTGQVIALIGGKSYIESQYNRALYSKRQVGSTMKPLLYYEALNNGFTVTSKFLSEKTSFTFSDDQIYSPKNFADNYANKEITMAQAVAYSDNIYAVKTHLFLGEQQLVDLSKKLGITSNILPIPSLALGSMEINLLEMTSAYNTFANMGTYNKLHFIRKVVDNNGNILYEKKDDSKDLLARDITYILNELLTSTYDENLIDYEFPTCYVIENKMNHRYSIKTGTSDSDYLIFGYNSDVLVSVWAGYDDSTEVDPYGGYIVKNIWVDTIEKYLEGKETNWYTKPDNVVGLLVNPITGNIASTNSDHTKIMYYLKGSEPIIRE